MAKKKQPEDLPTGNATVEPELSVEAELSAEAVAPPVEPEDVVPAQGSGFRGRVHSCFAQTVTGLCPVCGARVAEPVR